MGNIKNIKPYSIDTGNPVKLIRIRFNNKKIIKLKVSKCWKQCDSEIQEITHLIFCHDGFLEEVYK